jgi:iron complex transport system substrate-binding protein
MGRTTLIAMLFLAGCGGQPNSTAPNVASIQPPLETEVRLHYARSFRMFKRDPYRIITVVNSWKDSTEPTRYVLVPRGEIPPPDAKASEIIYTPVEKFAALSTTHLSAFDELGRLDGLVGFAGKERVVNPRVLERFNKGAIKTIGSGGGALQERIAAVGCDVLFASDFSEDAPAKADVLRRLGVQVVSAAEFSEEHPLGRAEWIRFFAAFFNEDEKAARLFQAQVDEYKRLSALAAKVSHRPTVMLNAPFGGSWHVPAGRSHAALLIEAAGGKYLWDDVQSSKSLSLQFEAVLAKAADADYWLNPGQWSSLEAMSKEDDRYRRFAPFRNGRVYNNDLKKSPDGGVDYWETGVNHPERVLADLIAIFHPELLPNHKMNWYRKLP